MNIRPIRSDEDHTAALRRIVALWGAEDGTPESDELEVLVDLVEHYEERTYPVQPLDPIDFLKAHMEATGRTQADLGRVLGARSRASEVMRRKRALTVEMIRRLSLEWHLPASCLIGTHHLAA